MQDRKEFYVYGYTRSNASKHGAVGSFYYIGKGKGNRAFDKHRVRPRLNANILMVSSGMVERDALQAEMLLIHLHGRIDYGTGCLRNRTDGGEGLANPSIETRRKISEAHKANGHVPPSRKGMKMPPTAVLAMIQRMTGKPSRNPNLGGWNKGMKMGPSPQRGVKRSDETRNKLRASHIGHIRSAASRAKQGASIKGHVGYNTGPVSAETRKKMSVIMKGKSTAWLSGRTLSEEHRKKIAEGVKRRFDEMGPRTWNTRKNG